MQARGRLPNSCAPVSHPALSIPATRDMAGSTIRLSVAVNAHGVLRFTKDLGLVIELIPDNIGRAFAALEGLGYRPSVPITAAQFAARPRRQGWIDDKGTRVLRFWSDAHGETPIDMFVSEPFPSLAEVSVPLPLTGSTLVTRQALPRAASRISIDLSGSYRARAAEILSAGPAGPKRLPPVSQRECARSGALRFPQSRSVQPWH